MWGTRVGGKQGKVAYVFKTNPEISKHQWHPSCPAIMQPALPTHPAARRRGLAGLRRPMWRRGGGSAGAARSDLWILAALRSSGARPFNGANVTYGRLDDRFGSPPGRVTRANDKIFRGTALSDRSRPCSYCHCAHCRKHDFVATFFAVVRKCWTEPSGRTP
jgi:hypothetical protein